MPLYIKSEEVADLVTRLAAVKGVFKQEAEAGGPSGTRPRGGAVPLRERFGLRQGAERRLALLGLLYKGDDFSKTNLWRGASPHLGT